jgi:hypothetical protein
MECTAVAVYKRDFWAWIQKYAFPCYGIFSAFNNIFKTLNLFLNKYLAEIQLPGNGILLFVPQTFYTEFWNGLPLVITITTSKEKMQLQSTVVCSWAFLLKPRVRVWQALLSFHHSAKHAHLHLPQANLGKMAIRAVL